MPRPCFAWIIPKLLFILFPICKNVFPIIDQPRFFVTSGIGPDSLMNVLKDCIVFLIWAIWVLFNFYRKQNNDFQSGALLEIPPLSPSKDILIFPKITKAIKKWRFQLGNFKYNKFVCFTGYIHYNNGHKIMNNG